MGDDVKVGSSELALVVCASSSVVALSMVVAVIRVVEIVAVGVVGGVSVVVIAVVGVLVGGGGSITIVKPLTYLALRVELIKKKPLRPFYFGAKASWVFFLISSTRRAK